MKLFKNLKISHKIQFAILFNVLFAIFIAEMLAKYLGHIDHNIVILINLGINCLFAGLYGFFISRAITKPIRVVVDSLKTISKGKGDLTVQLKVNSNDEIGELSDSFNQFTNKMHDIIFDLSSMIQSLNAAVDGFNYMGGMIKDHASNQDSKIKQMVAEIARLNESVSKNLSIATAVANDSATAADLAQEGATAVNNTIQGMSTVSASVNDSALTMQDLSVSSEQISEIIVVINNIAEQTNLLALNAAIEAARAGEQGRGFAVVADEVRALAARTSDATNEIDHMIGDIQSKIKQVVTTMDHSVKQVQHESEHADFAGNTLKDIMEKSKEVATKITNISKEIENQNNLSTSINDRSIQISKDSEQSTGSVSQVTEFSDNLSAQTHAMNEIVGQFKLNESKEH